MRTAEASSKDVSEQIPLNVAPGSKQHHSTLATRVGEVDGPSLHGSHQSSFGRDGGAKNKALPRCNISKEMMNKFTLISGAASIIGLFGLVPLVLQLVTNGIENRAFLNNTITNIMDYPNVTKYPDETEDTINVTVEYSFYPPIPKFENWRKLKKNESISIPVPRSFFTDDTYWCCVRWREEVKIFRFSGDSGAFSPPFKKPDNYFDIARNDLFINGASFIKWYWEYRNLRAGKEYLWSDDEAMKEVKRRFGNRKSLCENSSNSRIQITAFYSITIGLFMMFIFA